MYLQQLQLNYHLKVKWLPNPYTRWNQIDKTLPNEPITLVIPASNHGTREVFQEKMVDAGCELVLLQLKL